MDRVLSCFCQAGIVLSIIVPVTWGQTIVGPGQTLQVTTSTADDYQLNGGTLSPTDVTLTGTIELLSSSDIVRPQNPLINNPRGGPLETSLGPTHLNGPISGTGNLVLQNLSRDQVFINGENTYTGHTYIIGGQIIAATSTAFGSTVGTTTIQGGDVRIDVPTGERFRVEGGALRFTAGDFEPSEPITIAGGAVHLPSRDVYQVPVVVDGADGALHFSFNENASWTGGSTGTGNLRLVGRVGVDAPLDHDGDLVIQGVRLNVPNNYTGKTTIVDNYVIDRSDVFGTATSPIEMTDGEIRVEVLPAGNRGLTLTRGTLNIQTTEPVNSIVTLGGVFEANLRGIGTFNAPVDYVTVPGGGDAHISGGTFNAPIRGNTPLRLGGADGVTLNAANEIAGLVQVMGGTVTVNHATALFMPGTLIQGGLVEMNTAVNALPMLIRYPYGSQQTGTLRLNADQHFADLTYVGEGTLEVGGDLGFDHLLTRNSTIASTSTASITIDRELSAFDRFNIVSAKLKGDGNIRVEGSNLRATGDISEFNGDMFVSKGRLTIAGNTQVGSGDIYVGHGGTIDFESYQSTARVVHNMIFLNNGDLPFAFDSAGIARSGHNGGPLTLAGRLEIGPQGGTIRGSDGFRIAGEIIGESLTWRDSSLRIESTQTQLGYLALENSSLSFASAGSLHGLESIKLNGGRIDLPPSAATDRIGDNVAIHSANGIISLNSSSNLPTSETIGTLHVERGLSSVFNSSDHGSLNAGLTFGRIERDAGALLYFGEAGNVTNTRIMSVDTFDGTMVGAWAITNQGFASLNAQGKVGTLQATSGVLNTAGPDDHVSVGGGQLMTADRVVASLSNPPTGGSHSIDLGGHRLTVRSGGIFSNGDIVNGELTAGDGQATELILHNSRRVDASIVDNGPTGSVALVVADTTTTLAGTNAYTGGTWVVANKTAYYQDRARLTIERPEAIPDNDRVFLEYGDYEVKFVQPGVAELAEIHVRNNSIITGMNAMLDADAYYFEEGALSLPLTGDGTIYKDSNQQFEIGNKNPNFAGNVYVREGILRVNRDSLPFASLFVEGGRLEVSSQNSNLPNDVALAGGQLQGRFNGAIEVISDSTLYHGNGYTLLYGPLSGNGDLTIQGETIDRYAGIFHDASQFTGDLRVESGALRIGAPAVLGAGEIYVNEGAQLVLGSDRPRYGQTVVERDIHIHRGSLYVTPPSESFDTEAPNGLVTGDVYVENFAFFGANTHGRHSDVPVPGLVLGGSVILRDGAMIIGRSRDNSVFFGYEVPLIEVAGDLQVGTDNVWRPEFASVAFTGTIRAGAVDASIDFQGLASAVNLDSATLVAEAGHTLSVTINGAPRDIELSAGAGLAGNGSLASNFTLVDGATLAPGASPGALTILGDLELGPGAVYQWEMENPATGPGIGWDLVDVAGALAFDATPSSPWVLKVNSFASLLATGDSEWLIASATTIDGFDPTAINIVSDGTGDTLQQSLADQFSVELRGADLYLVRAVPEPTGIAGIALLGLALSTCCRTHRKRCG